jgi:hypothetical protein
MYAMLCCVGQDPPEEGGRHFDLMLAILTKIRQSEDLRDPSNIKIYKLAELAILCQSPLPCISVRTVSRACLLVCDLIRSCVRVSCVLSRATPHGA